MSEEGTRVADIRALIAARKRWDMAFGVIGVLALMVGVLTFTALFVDMLIDGAARLRPDFFTSFPSRRAAQAGILSAWVGSVLVMLVTAAAAVPLGVAAGVYLEEYAPRNWMTDLIEINVTNLAGVPSIIYGLLALGLFVYQFGLGQSILTAGLTLALLILPIVIVATRESIRAIPGMIREGAYALGATKWQTTSDHIIPYRDARHHDRRYHWHGAGDRRNRSDHYDRCAHVHRVPADSTSTNRTAVSFLRMALVSFHRDAHSNVQLDVEA